MAYAYHEQSITTLGCDWTISDGSGALTGALENGAFPGGLRNSGPMIPISGPTIPMVALEMFKGFCCWGG